MANLRQLLKEYLELKDSTIDEFLEEVKREWSPLIYNKMSDNNALEFLEQILGVPDWTKTP